MANIPKKPKKPNHTDPSSMDYTPPPRDAPPVANDSYNSATQVQENPWDFWGEMPQAILSVGDVASKLSDSNTFKNPFDMDGAFAQQFLNTDKALGLDKKTKNMEQEKKPTLSPSNIYIIKSDNSISNVALEKSAFHANKMLKVAGLTDYVEVKVLYKPFSIDKIIPQCGIVVIGKDAMTVTKYIKENVSADFVQNVLIAAKHEWGQVKQPADQFINAATNPEISSLPMHNAGNIIV
jgi:hypothetical protein